MTCPSDRRRFSQRRGARAAVLIAAALAVSLLALAGPVPATAEPVRPDDDTLVLATVPPGRAAAVAATPRLPNDLTGAVADARTAIEAGRTLSDPRFYSRAEAMLSPWWGEPAPPREVRVLRAVIRQARHDFSGAVADLDAILAETPRDGQARMTRAFVRMVQGEAAAAEADCRMIPPTAGPLPAATCLARAAALTGRGTEGFAHLERALAFDEGASPATRRFALAVLADLAAGLGRDAEADSLFAAASEGGADVPVLAARAEHLVATGRPAEALSLLEDAGDADPLLLVRAVAAKRIGDPRLDADAGLLAERFAAAAAAGVGVHRREEARFRLEVLDDPEGALALALDNWATQKEPIDARLVLAAAVAADRPEAAAPVLAFVTSSGLADRRVLPLVARIDGETP
jgi:tetratricopeptide (TPR) repeat protein